MVEKDVKLLNNVRILVYVGQLLKSTRKHVSDPYVLSETIGNRQILLKPVEVRRSSPENLLKCTLSVRSSCINSILILPFSIATRLPFHEGQWLKVKFVNFSKGMSIMRWVRIYFNRNQLTKYFLVSNILFHNISQKLKTKVFYVDFNFDKSEKLGFENIIMLWNANNKNNEIKHANTVSERDRRPKTAKSIKVSIVNSPCYKNSACVEQLLKRYFSTDIIVATGDIVTIPIPEYMSHLFTNSFYMVPPSEIFIFVRSIEADLLNNTEDNDSFIVNNAKSMLYLLSDISEATPSSVYSFDSENNEPNIYNWMEMHCDKLNKVINSHLTDDFKRKFDSNDKVNQNTETNKILTNELSSFIDLFQSLSLSGHILLREPRGSGAVEIVEIVSAMNNLHLYKVNAWNLKGDTSATTIARLQNKFNQAVSYGPCIMLLEHVSCLAKVSIFFLTIERQI